MDLRGYDKLNNTIYDAGFAQVIVEPRPKEDKDVRFVEVSALEGRTGEPVSAALILNVLYDARMMYHPEDNPATEDPALEFVSTATDTFIGGVRHRTVVTLEDRNIVV